MGHNRSYRRTRSEIEEIKSALYDAAKSEHPVTVRRLFYVLVGRALISKTEGEYKRTVVRLAGLMRESGELPFHWITDSTRFMRKPASFGSLLQAMDRAIETYRRELWADQGCRVEIWAEKNGLTGVLYSVTSSWDVPLMMCGGSPSKNFLWEAAQVFRAEGRPTFIYYLGDHDPTGVAIQRRVEADLRRYAPDADLTFETLAVTPDQIREFDLATRPTKKTDPNAAKFVGDSVEVDALPAQHLRTLVSDAIVQHIDPVRHARLQMIEDAERETLASLRLDVLGATL